MQLGFVTEVRGVQLCFIKSEVRGVQLGFISKSGVRGVQPGCLVEPEVRGVQLWFCPTSFSPTPCFSQSVHGNIRGISQALILVPAAVFLSPIGRLKAFPFLNRGNNGGFSKALCFVTAAVFHLPIGWLKAFPV